MTIVVDLVHEMDSVIRLREAWERENALLAATLAECNQAHTSPPNNYWQDEYRARQRYQTAREIYRTLGGQGRV